MLTVDESDKLNNATKSYEIKDDIEKTNDPLPCAIDLTKEKKPVCTIL